MADSKNSLEAVLIQGLNYAFDLNSKKKTDFIYCKAAVILPVQTTTTQKGRTVECNRALRLYFTPEIIEVQKFIRPDEQCSVEKRSDGIYDVHFGESAYRLCNFGGDRNWMFEHDFSDLAGLEQNDRRQRIEQYISNWLKGAFKDGAK